jgi:hypothetical protein
LQSNGRSANAEVEAITKNTAIIFFMAVIPTRQNQLILAFL